MGTFKKKNKFLSSLRKAEDLKIKGQYQEAIKILEKLLIDDPECLEAVEELADNLLFLDQFEKARNAANFAISLNKESFIANHILGFIALHERRWSKAVGFLKKANQGNPNHPEILRCLGWGLFHKKEKKEGIATLERALLLEKNNPMILCDLGVCFLQENKITAAKNLFHKALEITPENERVIECLNIIRKIESDLKIKSKKEINP